MEVDATDADAAALAVAKDGVYRLGVSAPGDHASSIESFGDLPADLRSEAFAVDANTATVAPAVRAAVAFREADLRCVPERVAATYHLVVCRHSGFLYLRRADTIFFYASRRRRGWIVLR